MDLDELDEIEMDGEFGYSFSCRCSGQYVLLESEMVAGKQITQCNNCSLRIRVLFQTDEEEEE